MYEKKDFKYLLGTPGFSDALLENHFKLYEGYVGNVNTLAEKLAQAQAGTPEYAEQKRRFGWEWNGMRLHELYFENMKKDAGATPPEESALYKKIVSDFSSYEAWENDFKSTGALRGIGWAVLSYDRQGKRLFNTWVNEHDVGHLAGAEPILIMDVFEHAFMLDYGLKRADYIAAFMKAVNWGVVSERFS
ncbi:MAG: superoxide dismutase [Candidatus Lloydbacteria bacterium]|nr:superoxide dismutase [Candidatus Lloydbacteria bacterium]